MHYVANAGTSVAVHTQIEFACVHVFHRSHQYPGEGLPWSHYPQPSWEAGHMKQTHQEDINIMTG